MMSAPVLVSTFPREVVAVFPSLQPLFPLPPLISNFFFPFFAPMPRCPKELYVDLFLESSFFGLFFSSFFLFHRGISSSLLLKSRTDLLTEDPPLFLDPTIIFVLSSPVR